MLCRIGDERTLFTIAASLGVELDEEDVRQIARCRCRCRSATYLTVQKVQTLLADGLTVRHNSNLRPKPPPIAGGSAISTTHREGRGGRNVMSGYNAAMSCSVLQPLVTNVVGLEGLVMALAVDDE